MNTAAKIVPLARIVEVAREMRQAQRRIVFTNGCFDLLHVGHVRLFSYIKRECGDRSFVIVGVNSDDSVRAIKGPNRPINHEIDRAEIIAGLRAVDCVTVFRDKRVNVILDLIQPHVWAKGGDYTVDSLDAAERKAAKDNGTEILLLPMTHGKSTTAIISKIDRGHTALQ